MKKIFFISILTSLFCLSCQEEYIGQYPTDDVAPGPVTNVSVDNLPGKAIVHYSLPAVPDIMGIKVMYTHPTTGKYSETWRSAYSSYFTLSGFGKSTPTKLTLVSVDNSYNESEPEYCTIEPLDSPIYEMLNTLEIEEDFGGLSIKWENPHNEEIMFGVVSKDDDGNITPIDGIYSSFTSEKRSVRGLDSVPTNFGFFFKDMYDNYSDTLYAVYTPVYEEHLDKSQFTPAHHDTKKFSFHKFGGKAMEMMWDNIYDATENCFYVNNKTETTDNPEHVYFSFDMKVTAKLSRIKLWTRKNYYFQLHHIRKFQLYGTNDPEIAKNSALKTGWEFIGEFESIRPSGATTEGNVTKEEEEYCQAGEEWMIPQPAKPYRYIKFQTLCSWSNSYPMFIEEMDLYGAIISDESDTQ